MKRGFTLIEMLVVSAIISLLISLLVPVTSSVLERGKATQCKSNLRTMAQAVSIYATEHQGFFPPALVQSGSETQGWDFFSSGSGSDQELKPGWIWEDYGINHMLQCPGYSGSDNWQGEAYTGYNYNTSYLGGMKTVVRGRVIRDVPSSNIVQVKTPASTAMFGDGEYASGANKFMRAPYPGDLDADFSGRAAGTQGFRHNGQTNVVFVDGHVESREPLVKGQSTGFLSADNDLYDLD
ncbi:prepilin-type N-terminal cleavage/methylation domain-containing protein [Kiritimatiellaeota bacterium B1221]|nr:prepilin-type N-terminal cleavage/methylation domain-containing protein [Kiritimatiellaeota bacterium B1221]